MDDDYYSYKPRLTLQRPLALVGIPGTYPGVTSRVVSMLLGLNLVWVDRKAEHIHGATAESVEVRVGREARLEVERTVIAAGMAGRKPPVIACSTATFTDPELRSMLEQQCELIHLRIELDEALQRVQSDVASDRRKHYALWRGETFEPDVVRSRLIEQGNRYRGIERIVDVDGRLPLTVGRGIVAELEAAAT